MKARMRVGRTVGDAIGADAKKPHKYRAKRTVVDGIKFDSKFEAQRYGQLKLIQAGGLIRDLRIHPSFDLVVNGVKVGRYTADFEYWCLEKNARVIEDAKGMPTPIYRLKKRLMKAIHGIEIVEITRGKKG